MEFTFFTRPTEDKTFARVKIYDPRARKEAYTFNTSGFYFIGKSTSNIEKLVRAFKGGYASENTDTARSELTRCLKQVNRSLPEVIFCEPNISVKDLRNFCIFLNSHPVLRSVPVILDGTNLNEKDWGLHKKSKLVDEIIILSEAGVEQVQAKCRFLAKVKLKAAKTNVPVSSRPALKIPFAAYLSKRVFDITVSSLALLLISPLFLLIGLAIRLESKGSIFYISKRAGMGYKIFDFYKFRTMQMNADKNIDEYAHLNQYSVSGEKGPMFFKINNDPRVTKVGAFLRNTSLDELPQLINVLLGDMSLVGNRPLPLYEAATLTTDVNAQRFLAPAGITGLWQIKKRGKEDMSTEERINLDIDYANKYSFLYDLWIMANTPSALLQKGNV